MVCIFRLLFFVLQLTLVEGLLLPFLYIHTCVIFNKNAFKRKKRKISNIVDITFHIPEYFVETLKILLIGLSMAWHGMAWHGMVWYGMTCACTCTWHDTVRYGMVIFY